jgi:hypothetical protein
MYSKKKSDSGSSTVTADETSPCAVCWDGTLGVFRDGMCGCPPAVIVVPDVPEDEEET